MQDYQLSRPYSMGWHPASWVLRIHGSSPQVLRGTKTFLTRWLRERRGKLPFYVHLIVRADFGPLGGVDYVLLLDRPEDHIAILAGPDGTPVEIDLRPHLDPDDVALRTRPGRDGRAGLTVHSVVRRVVGFTVWTEAHCYPGEDRSDLVVYRSSDQLRTWRPAAYCWAQYEGYRRTGQPVVELRRVIGIDSAAEVFLRDAVLLLLRRPHVPLDVTDGDRDG
jgi:hypothetical protein